MITFLRMCAPNGERYPRVGGRRERHFGGANFKPRKLSKNAATPTRRVHAVLARFLFGEHRKVVKFCVWWIN